MSVLTQDQLKALFETADVPTQQDFTDLIDTLESNSAVVLTSVAGTGDVWADVNSTTALVQTTKQVNVINHNGIFYLFNAGVGSFGLGGTATVTGNFIAISYQLIEGAVAIQTYEILQSNQLAVTDVATLVTQINTSEVITHATNQVTIIKYRSIFQQKTTSYFLFNGPAGTYGLANTQISSAYLKEVSVTSAPTNVSVISQTISNPTGDISTWVNANEVIAVSKGYLLVIHYGTDLYLFNPELDAYGNPKIYGPGYAQTDPDNFVLLVDKADTTTTIPIVEASYLAGTGVNIDFSTGDNFYLPVDGSGVTALATTFPITATNLLDGKTGYIIFTRGGAGLGAATNFSFSSDYTLITSGSPIIDANNFAWYFYEIITVPQAVPGSGGNPKIFITTSTGETSLWI